MSEGISLVEICGEMSKPSMDLAATMFFLLGCFIGTLAGVALMAWLKRDNG